MSFDVSFGHLHVFFPLLSPIPSLGYHNWKSHTHSVMVLVRCYAVFVYSACTCALWKLHSFSYGVQTLLVLVLTGVALLTAELKHHWLHLLLGVIHFIYNSLIRLAVVLWRSLPRVSGNKATRIVFGISVVPGINSKPHDCKAGTFSPTATNPRHTCMSF